MPSVMPAVLYSICFFFILNAYILQVQSEINSHKINFPTNNNHYSHINKKLKSIHGNNKVNIDKSSHLPKMNNYFNEHKNEKDFFARNVNRHVIKENVAKSSDIKKQNNFSNKNHIEKKSNESSKRFWRNKNKTTPKGVVNSSVSKTRNIQVKKNISDKHNRHDRNKSAKNAIKHEFHNKSKSPSFPSKNTHNMKKNLSHTSHKSKKALEFHIFNGKSKTLHGSKGNSQTNKSEHNKFVALPGKNKNNTKKSPTSHKPKEKFGFQLFNGKSKGLHGKTVNHHKNYSKSNEKQKILTHPNSNKFIKFKSKRKVGLHANFHPKAHVVNETFVKIRKRQILKHISRSLRSDESSILHKIKDFIVNNFPKNKERRAVNASNNSNIKQENKELLDEMKDFLVKNFESETMESTLSNLNNFSSDDSLTIEEEPNSYIEREIRSRSERESITVSEYDDGTEENKFKRETDLSSTNDPNAGVTNSEINTVEYNNTVNEVYNAGTTNDLQTNSNSDFTTEKSFIPNPSSVFYRKRAIFAEKSPRNSIDDAATENFSEENISLTYSELENSSTTEDVINFTVTSTNTAYVTASNKKYRENSENELLTSDFPVSRSSSEISDYETDTISPNTSVDESSLASTADLVSDVANESLDIRDLSSTLPENYTNDYFENSSLIFSQYSTQISNSMVHSNPKNESKLRDQNKREVFQNSEKNSDLEDSNYEELESTTVDLPDDFEEHDYGIFHTIKNKVEMTKSEKEHNLMKTLEKTSKSFDKRNKNKNYYASHGRFPPQNMIESKPNNVEKTLLEKNQKAVHNEEVVDEDYDDMAESKNTNSFSSTGQFDRQKQISKNELSYNKKHYNGKNNLLDSADDSSKTIDTTETSTEIYYDENQLQSSEFEDEDKFSPVSEPLGRLNYKNNKERGKTTPIMTYINRENEVRSNLHEDENHNTEYLKKVGNHRVKNVIKTTQSDDQEQGKESDSDYEDSSKPSEIENGFDTDVDESDADESFFQNDIKENEREINRENRLPFKENDDKSLIELAKYSLKKPHDRFRKKDDDRDSKYYNKDDFESDFDTEQEINNSTDKSIYYDDLPESTSQIHQISKYGKRNNFIETNSVENYKNKQNQSKVDEKTEVDYADEITSDPDNSQKDQKTELSTIKYREINDLDKTSTDNVPEIDDVELSNGILVSNENEVTTEGTMEAFSTLQNLKDAKIRALKYGNPHVTYAVTLQNVKVMPDKEKEIRGVRNWNSGEEIGESTTWLEEGSQNPNIEYYDEMSNNNHHDHLHYQKGATVFKNLAKNVNEISPKKMLLTNTKQTVRITRNKSTNTKSSHDKFFINTNFDSDTLQKSVSPEKKIINEKDSNTVLESAKGIQNKLQVEKDVKPKNTNKLKQYLDVVAHSKHKHLKKIRESSFQKKTRKTRAVLSIEPLPTPLPKMDYQGSYLKFIESRKNWLIGTVGLLTICLMSVSMYRLLPKRSITKLKCDDNLFGDGITKNGNTSDTKLCITDEDGALSNDFKYVNNFISEVLNMCEDFEDRNLEEDYSTEDHLLKIRLARNGTIG